MCRYCAASYGHIGGTGIAGYIIPATGTVVVWMGQMDPG